MILIAYYLQKASPAEINGLQADALCLQDDTFLNPVIPDDPLLR
jgi:hypothetical protein